MMNTTLQKNRIYWIDNLKAIGIIFVVFGHLFYTDSTVYIYSFHMPLFFFTSGYLFKIDLTETYPDFLKKKTKNIIIPYLFFSLVTYTFWVFVGRHFGDDASSNVELMTPFIGIFYSNGVDLWLIHSTPLWFLTCLFVTENIFYFLKKTIKGYLRMLLALVIISIIGFFDSCYMPIRLPWGADVALTALVFFGIGNLVKETDVSFNNKYLNSFYIILFTAVNVAVSKINGRVNMCLNSYGNYFYFYLASLSGIATYFFMAKNIPFLGILSFIGRNTLIVLGFHTILISLLKGLQLFVFKIPLSVLDNSLFWSSVYTLAIFTLLIPLILIMNNYFPTLVGRQSEK